MKTHKKEFKLLAGITQDDELYFLEIDPTNDKRNGYDEFSMRGFTVKPITEDEAKENAHNYLYGEGEYFWRQAVEAKNTTLGLDEWIEQVQDEDEMGSFDNSLYPESVDIEGTTWLFESCSCGQHQEKDLKHYFIDKKLFTDLMTLWDKHHLKPTPDSQTLETAEKIEQDMEELTIEAINIINE